jgi:phenylalanyl-tRNA synthetase alpha chain
MDRRNIEGTKMTEWLVWASEAIEGLDHARSMDELEAWRLHHLSKQGVLAGHFQSLKSLSGEAKKEAGVVLNQCRDRLQDAYQRRREILEEAALAARLAADSVDITLPSRPGLHGTVHPITQAGEEAMAILASLGFVQAEGPNVESLWYNFTALNMPPSHPARQMHDSFYLGDPSDPSVLRTHTSPVQIRAMQAGEPPFAIASMGRTYRSDWDATHTPMFHQIEWLAVDRDLHLGHLQWMLEHFLAEFFEKMSMPIRLRPSFFPFTEPSFEVDVLYRRGPDGSLILGEGGDSWLEILGCGMVHPRVLEAGGVDAKRFRGFAAGMGVERLAMLKYGIGDLRLFFDHDPRFLAAQGFHPWGSVPLGAMQGRSAL